jgi:hypothetical protein
MKRFLSPKQQKFLKAENLAGFSEGEQDILAKDIRQKLLGVLDDLILVFKAEERWRYSSDKQQGEFERQYEPLVKGLLETYIEPETESYNQYINDVHAYERICVLLDSIQPILFHVLTQEVTYRVQSTLPDRMSLRWYSIDIAEIARRFYGDLAKKE